MKIVPFLLRRLQKISISISLLLAITTPWEAYAGSSNFIELGAGVETTLPSEGFNLLLKVGYRHIQSPDDVEADPVLGPDQIIWAHISCAIILGESPSGTLDLPKMEISIIPLHNAFSVYLESGNALFTDFRLLPSKVSRDIRIDQDLSIQVSAVGLQVGLSDFSNEQITLFAQAAIDAVGYKLVDSLILDKPFQGTRILGTELKIGAVFKPTEDLKIEIIFGAAADLDLGTRTGDFLVQSDFRTYTEVRADIERVMNIFTNLSYLGQCVNDRIGCRSSVQLQSGAQFKF